MERVSTGIRGIDNIIDDLRMGDNVVWQVESVDDYKYFVEPFVNYGLQNNHKIVYMRFGKHQEIVQSDRGIRVYHLDPERGFEAFSAQVHKIADSEGSKVLYIFDCLSDLLSIWDTDLMIGNFFKVTCPYMFELNTIAYFCILRNRNSYETIARIRETTQVLFDVYRRGEQLFIHPLKVFNRYSPTMFLPHLKENGKFVAVTSSVEAARVYSASQSHEPGNVSRKLDYWDRVFLMAQELIEKQPQTVSADSVEYCEMLERLCRMMIGREEKILSLALKYFSLSDLLAIRNRLLGTGFIGGKTVGMLLARKILAADKDINWESWLEPHDSFYIGADVYYTYMVENNCWKLRLEQKKEEYYFAAAADLKEKILNGIFPDSIREQFYQMLEYFGQSPIIVRSSSLLEDAFGNAFAGKYDSIFCVNQGTLEERYELFEKAVKQVYASTMNEDALAYRLQRGLAGSDEQMALLVQRVSGAHHGQYFFPDLAGVAMSCNPYVWRDDMSHSAGMMRIVMGLGTRAVDRVDSDYPRVVALDKPLLRPDSSPEEIRRFSQHKVDLLDMVLNDLETLSLNRITALKSGIQVWELLAEQDYETMQKVRMTGRNTEKWILTFDKLLTSTPVAEKMNQMLRCLEAAYDYPVDTEFTINFNSEGRMQVNLLQCRPLQTIARTDLKMNPKNENDTTGEILFSASGSFMGSEVLQGLKIIIYIKPDKYIKLPIKDKYQIARLVGNLNRSLDKKGSQPFMLIGPGRWGTSTPSLGIPVSFGEICNAAVLVEVADKKEGYMPELSFGTHFFQDLVETRIFYAALFPGEEGFEFNTGFLEKQSNSLSDLFPSLSKWQDVIKLIDLSREGHSLWIDLDLKSQQMQAYLVP